MKTPVITNTEAQANKDKLASLLSLTLCGGSAGAIEAQEAAGQPEELILVGQAIEAHPASPACVSREPL